jgi:hypothetical protein
MFEQRVLSFTVMTGLAAVAGALSIPPEPRSQRGRMSTNPNLMRRGEPMPLNAQTASDALLVYNSSVRDFNTQGPVLQATHVGAILGRLVGGLTRMEEPASE